MAPVVLSFLISTIILLALSRALGVNVDVGRWQTLLSISLIFTIFSVWLGHRAKGPTADFSYAQSSLTLAIGALTAIGGQVGGAWFAYIEHESVAANASVLGVMLDRATSFADIIYLILVNVAAVAGCVVCFIAAGVLRGRTDLTRGEQSRLFGWALILLIANIMLQRWVEPRAGDEQGSQALWLVIVLASLAALFALLRWLSFETPRLSFAIAQSIGEATRTRALLAGQIALQLVWGIMVGAARAFFIIVGVAAVLGVGALIMDGLVDGPASAARAGVYSAFNLAAPLNQAGLPLLFAILIGLALLVAAPSLSASPLESTLRARSKALQNALSWLARLARAAVVPTTLALLAASIAALVFANLPSFEASYDGIDRIVRASSDFELSPLSNAAERALFALLAFGFVAAAFASLALVLIAAFIMATVLIAAIWRVLGRVGAHSAKAVEAGATGLFRLSQQLADALGALIVEALGALWRLLSGLAILSAVGLGGILVVAMVQAIPRLSVEAPASRPPVSAPNPAAQIAVEIDPVFLTGFWFVLALLALAIAWRPLLLAWRVVRRPVMVIVQSVVVVSLLAAVAVVATPAYLALVEQLTRLGNLIGVNLAAWFVLATEALAQLPPLLARLIIAFVFAATVGLAFAGGITLITILSIATLIRLGVSASLIGRAVGSTAGAIGDALAAVFISIGRAWRAVDWTGLARALWRPIPWLVLIGLIGGLAWLLMSNERFWLALSSFVQQAVPYVASAIVLTVAGWLTWRLRRVVIAQGPRVAAVAAVVLIVLVAGIPREPTRSKDAAGSEPPIVPEAEAAEPTVSLRDLLLDRSARWQFDSARYLVTANGVTPAEGGVSIDHDLACASRTIIVVGAASSEGSPVYNRALASCRAARVAEIVKGVTSDCNASIWLLNLGPHSRSIATAEDRLPAIIALGEEGAVDETYLEALLARQSPDFAALLQGRSISDYDNPEWRRWSHPEARMQANDLLQACEGLGR